jgi:hypothetical protein
MSSILYIKTWGENEAGKRGISFKPRVSVLECGGNPAERERHRFEKEAQSSQPSHVVRKRRRRCALPAQSRTLTRGLKEGPVSSLIFTPNYDVKNA